MPSFVVPSTVPLHVAPASNALASPSRDATTVETHRVIITEDAAQKSQTGLG